MNQIYKLLWELCLLEDHADHDITGKACIAAGKTCEATLIAKSKGVFSGADFIDFLAEFYPNLSFKLFVTEAESVDAGTKLLSLQGNARLILSIERSLLNILMQVYQILFHKALQ